MSLNLLSDQAKDGGKPAQKIADAPVVVRSAPVIKKEVQKVVAVPVVPAVKEIPMQKVQKESNTFTEPEAALPGFGVNILGGSDTYALPRSLVSFFIVLAAVLCVGALTIGGWWTVLHNEQSRITSDTATLTATIGELRAGAAKSIATRKNIEARLREIDTARTLLARHIHWTRFFQFLETATIPDAYYRSLAVDPGGTIRLAAIGRDFAAVARQLLAFQESDDVETVHMAKAASEIVGDAPGVQFDLELKVKPTLLYAEK